MFANLFNHLLTAVGMIALIALAIIIVAIIVSITYLAVKACVDSLRGVINDKKEK